MFISSRANTSEFVFKVAQDEVSKFDGRRSSKVECSLLASHIPGYLLDAEGGGLEEVDAGNPKCVLTLCVFL